MKIKTNFRVVATSTTNGHWMSAKTPEEHLLRSARALEDEIKRHCDYADSTQIEWDNECSFCGLSWEEETGENKGRPLCCDEAIKEFEAKKL